MESVIFKNDKRMEKNSKDGVLGKIFSILSFVIVFGTLAISMIIASIYITRKLNEINQIYAFINLMLYGNFAILFLESIFQVLNVLYFSKDLKQLLRMPIKSKDIVHGKLLKIITSEYEMEIIMIAIPMIAFGLMNHVEYQFYMYIPFIILILPIIPISVISVIIAVIMRFTNLIKNKSKVMYIAIIVATILLNIVLSIFEGQGSILNVFNEQVLLKENGLAIEIANSFKLIIPIMNSLQNYNTILGVYNLALFCLVSVGIYVIAILLISPIYLKGAIGTVINGDRSSIKEKVTLTEEDFKEKSYLYAISDVGDGWYGIYYYQFECLFYCYDSRCGSY